MGTPGKVAFPVILALGAVTGYITYTYFTNAIPEADRIDSPYYHPLSPASGGNETSNTGGGGGQVINESQHSNVVTVKILQGAAVQGSPDFDPDKAQVPVGNKIVWDNQDTVPHTATSGTGPSDPNSAKLFDTSIINGGEKSNPVEVKGAKQGDTITYHCTIHPYMTGEITIAAAGGQGGGGGGAQTGGNQTGAAPTGAAGGGPTINILQGASIQGSPDFDPEELTAKKGDEVTVVNQDTVPHTVTSGTGPSDPNSAKLFDTSIINGGESAKISLAQVNPGQYDYHCTIHPYMTGKITVG
jgi:plastocyanin